MNDSMAIDKVYTPGENDEPAPALEGTLVPLSPTLLPEGLVIHEASSLDENPAAVYLAGLAPGSRRAMSDALEIIASMLSAGATARSLPWHQLRFAHTQAIRARLRERYAAATCNKMLSALRGVLKAAWRLGQMDAEAYQRARDVGSVHGETLPAGRSLSTGEIGALMEACLSHRLKNGRMNPLGVRDAAILSLLYGCGLRRAEVAALQVADWRREEAGVSLRVRGKRNKERLVPLVGGAADAVADWVELRGDAEGALFVPFRRGGHPQSGPMSTQAIYKMLAARAKEAGVASFSPHDCRRSFVGDLLDRGADIVTVQKLAGHANVTTTARYDRRGETVKRKAAELLHVPYRRRGER